MDPSARFDQAYYHEHYQDLHRRVSGRAEVASLVRFVASYLRYLDVDVASALDLGCGLGRWRAPLRRAFPDIDYRGVELSAHACERYGWERGSVVDFRGRGADLVICQGVLQYLDARDAERAIENLARLTRGALYLEALTCEDWRDACDTERTDGDVHLRSASFYRELLARSFVACGGGLFVPKNGPTVLFALERL